MEESLFREMDRVQRVFWYDRARRHIVMSLIDRYLMSAGRPKFLDLGCGTGIILADLERLGDVVGIDSSSEAISYASKCTKARLIKGNLPEDLFDLGERFDCVLMLDILEHLEDDEGAVSAASRIILPNGILIITVPAYQWLYAPRDSYRQHLRRYSRSSLLALLNKSGMKIELLSYYNMLLFPPAICERLLSKLCRVEPSPDIWMPPVVINEMLERVFASEGLLLPHVSLPFGLSLVSVLRAGPNSDRSEK